MASLRIALLILLAHLINSTPLSAATNPVHAFEQGRFGEAIKLWIQQLPNLRGEQRVDTLLNLASAYQAQGRVQEALNVLEQAQALTRSHRNRNQHALVLSGLSDVYLLSRRLDEARRMAEDSVEWATKRADPLVRATALNQLGHVLMAQQRYSAALDRYRDATELAHADPVLSSKLLINRLHALLANDETTTALPVLSRALSITRALAPPYDKTYGLLALGHLAQQLQPKLSNHRSTLTRWAYEAFSEAQSIAEQLDNPRAVSYAKGHLAQLYIDAQRHDEAQRLLRQALFAAERSDAEELLARWHHQIGRSLSAQNKPERAKAAYRRALVHLERIQPALILGQRGRQSFRETTGAIYLELAELLLGSWSQSDTASQRNALHEARAVMEQFKSVELKTYFLDDCVAVQQERNRSVNLDRLLDQHTAALYPIVFPDRLVLLLNLSAGELKLIDVPVSAVELRQTAHEFRRQLTHSGSLIRLRILGQTLYDWLIRPIETELNTRRITTLVMVPDDVLFTLPFAALFDGQHYLIQRYALAVTPGLALTETAQERDHEPWLLLNGLTQSVQQFPALTHVRTEINKIAQHYAHTTLLDQAFKKRRVQTQLERLPHSAVLFATHGRFSNDPQQSFLLTYDDRITLSELDRFVRFGQSRDQPLDLLVLSACETAEGDERAALGLAGVAVKAGARSVVASLWAVNDASTAELIPTFFQRLKSHTGSKAQALQHSQLQLLNHATYSHPFHWAPFILIGNWL